MSQLSTSQIILLILPLLIIELGLVFVAIRDLRRADRRVRGVNKVVWALVIILSPALGVLLYFGIGRDDA